MSSQHYPQLAAAAESSAPYYNPTRNNAYLAFRQHYNQANNQYTYTPDVVYPNDKAVIEHMEQQGSKFEFTNKDTYEFYYFHIDSHRRSLDAQQFLRIGTGLNPVYILHINKMIQSEEPITAESLASHLNNFPVNITLDTDFFQQFIVDLFAQQCKMFFNGDEFILPFTPVNVLPPKNIERHSPNIVAYRAPFNFIAKRDAVYASDHKFIHSYAQYDFVNDNGYKFFYIKIYDATPEINANIYVKFGQRLLKTVLIQPLSPDVDTDAIAKDMFSFTGKTKLQTLTGISCFHFNTEILIKLLTSNHGFKLKRSGIHFYLTTIITSIDFE